MGVHRPVNPRYEPVETLEHTYTHIHICIHVYIHINIYIYTYVHIYIYTYIHIYIYTYIHIYIYTHIHIYIYTHIHIYIYTYTYMYIYIYIPTYIHTNTDVDTKSHPPHPPTTRTPLKNTVNTDTNTAFSESNFGAVSTDWKHKCKTQNSKTFHIYGILQVLLDFWFFNLLDFWNAGFLDVCILFPWTCGYLHTRNCISVHRRCHGQIILQSIYALYIYICALAKPSFCSGGRTCCKPTNGALLHTSTHKIMILKA